MPPSQSGTSETTLQQQQVHLTQANRGTMFSPPARTNLQPASTQQLVGQTLLAELKAKRTADTKSECINLDTIRESQTEDQEGDVTTHGYECQYGVVTKKGRGIEGEHPKAGEDEGDVADSEVLLHEALLAKNNRQSQA